MKNLKELVDNNLLLLQGNLDIAIEGITDNSKKVKDNYAFFAIEGTKIDGHNFIESAIEKGAKVVFFQRKDVYEKLKSRYPNITFLLSENTRKSLAKVANRFYDNPSDNLKVIAVTGTNGKTTTTNLLSQYYTLAGFKVGLIGTISYSIGDEILDSGHTTPDPVKWFKTLKKMKDKGADVVIAEVSSHAADQFRVFSTKFFGGIFTNLTQDHLDYHKDMENYFLSKREVFNQIHQFNENAIYSINTDDEYGKKIYSYLLDNLNIKKEKVITYGRNSEDFKILNYNLDLFKTQFRFLYRGDIYNVETKLRGIFNIYNLSAVISFLLKDNFKLEFLLENARNLNPVKGRFQIVEGNGFIVVIDYAHTPDALENILKSLLEIKKGKVITVFGAGGNRDKTKRPLMGKIAEKYSDLVIVTSDNPRDEDPRDIANDILQGISDKSKSLVILDREEAIKYSIDIAKENDIVLVAGKGHENYQIIKDKVLPFDDFEVINKYIKRSKYV